MLPVFAKRTVGSITRAEVRRFIAAMLDGGAAPGTAANARKVLRLVLNEAVEANALKANPCDRVRVPRGRREEMVFLTPEEISVLAHEIANPPRPVAIRPGPTRSTGSWCVSPHSAGCDLARSLP